VAASHDLAGGPQGHGLARRARAPALPAPAEPAEFRFGGDLYSQ